MGKALVFYEALPGKGVPAEMHIYQKGDHGFSFANGKKNLSSWKNRCIGWLHDIRKEQEELNK